MLDHSKVRDGSEHVDVEVSVWFLRAPSEYSRGGWAGQTLNPNTQPEHALTDSCRLDRFLLYYARGSIDIRGCMGVQICT